MVIEKFYNVFELSKLPDIGTVAALTSVIRCWSSGRAGSLLSCAIVLCGCYKDFMRGDGKLTSSTKSERETVKTWKNLLSAEGPGRVKGNRGQKDMCSPPRKYD